jgi:flagellar hook-length control protein FliK
MTIAAAATLPSPGAPAAASAAAPVADSGFAAQIDGFVSPEAPLASAQAATMVLPSASVTLSLAQVQVPVQPAAQPGPAPQAEPATSVAQPVPDQIAIGGKAVSPTMPSPQTSPLPAAANDQAADETPTPKVGKKADDAEMPPAPLEQPAQTAVAAAPSGVAAPPAPPIAQVAAAGASVVQENAPEPVESSRPAAPATAHRRGGRSGSAGTASPSESLPAEVATAALPNPSSPTAITPIAARTGHEPADLATDDAIRQTAASAGRIDAVPQAQPDAPAAAHPAAHAAGAPGAFSSMVEQSASAPAAPLLPDSLSPAASASAPATPVVPARQIGRSLGVEIARRVADGGDTLTIRLDPAELGRIEVQLSFDRHGSLRAVMSADSPVALDLLRRDSGQLGQALADAGIRSDGQSLQFDSRPGGSGGNNAWQRQQQQPAQNAASNDPHAESNERAAIYRPLRTSGNIDLMA